MKNNKEPLRFAMDRRLSFLNELPSCRAALHYRIAQEEAPAMKKKLSAGLVFAIVLVMLTVAALAAGLLISPRAAASRAADQALARDFGITEEMQTFFVRSEEPLPEGNFRITYTGAGSLEYVLGTYTVLVRDGQTDTAWNRSGNDISGGYKADAWGLEQLLQMTADAEKGDKAYLEQAERIAEKHRTGEDASLSEVNEDYAEQLEAEKTAALKARRISEEDMIATAREFILSSYGLNEEQAARMELYTNSIPDENPNSWYWMINSVPCFQVEYLLYSDYTTDQLTAGEPRPRTEMDGYYNIYISVETGAVESFEYNSALNGLG